MQSAHDMGMKVVGKPIEVHEEAPETAHLVLPPASRLSEADMRTTGGGSRIDWDPTDTDWSDSGSGERPSGRRRHPCRPVAMPIT